MPDSSEHQRVADDRVHRPNPSTIDMAGKSDVHEQPTLTPAPPLDVAEQPTLAPGVAQKPVDAKAACGGDLIFEARRFGDYELLGELARGGMGIVYRARERQSGRLVALKMMLDECTPDSAQLQRFNLEARATGELNHPGIVAIHAWGEHEGRLFYTMDYVAGSPLSRLMKRKPLPIERAERYMLGIARAVQAAHAQGIVHRDLKPSNVMIDSSGQPRVLDFGLAKRQDQPPHHGDVAVAEVKPLDEVLDALPSNAPASAVSAPSPERQNSPHHTEKGAVLGTPSYMAPEQARGEQSQVGPRADVHALGAIFFEMLTGRPPFEAATVMDTLIQVMEQEPPQVRSLNPLVPASLAEVCQRCLAKNPQDRYADAGALADELEERWQRTVQKRRFARLAAWAGLAALVLFGIRFFMPGWAWLWSEALADRMRSLAEIGGTMMQGTAAVLGSLLSFVIALLPYLALLAFVAWSAAWLWYRISRPRQKRREGDDPQAQGASYLQKLFAVAESAPRSAGPAGNTVQLADVELGKTLQASPTCLLRKGRQKSLDRPVLAWMDTRPLPEGAPAPGVMVHHPSVLTLHAVTSCPEGRFLVTEATPATPLADLLDHRHLEPLEAVAMVVKIAYALQAFHDQGACHGQLAPEWILAQGDLEPLLCPCGVPSQSLEDRGQDVVRLGTLLLEWLPQRPRRWQRKPLATLYRVCDAATRETYSRPADLAVDLERAAYASLVRWRGQLAAWAVVALFVLPMVALAIARNFALSSKTDDQSQPLGEVGQFAMNNWLLLIAPSAVLLGFIHGRTFANYLRLRPLQAVRAQLWKESILPAAVSMAILTLVPSGIACYLLSGEGLEIGPRVLFLGVGELLGFWFLGVWLTAIVAFLEVLVGSLRSQATDGVLDSVGILATLLHALPRPQQSSRTPGSKSLNRRTDLQSKES